MDTPLPKSLGFAYDPITFRTDPFGDVARACFRVRKVLEGVVHDTVALEGNPFTLSEVKMLLDGVTVGGHLLEDERQVLNQAASWKELLARAQQGSFELNHKTFCALHTLVAREEAVEWGAFRTGSVTIAGTDYEPPCWESLEAIFEAGLEVLRRIDNLHERAIAVAHPDLATAGGILETKKIGDAAQERGIAMAMHMAMTPVAALAAVHCAAATENFLVLENHSVDDLERWSSLVEGLPVPLIESGHIDVPEGPGLGFTDLNHDVLRECADPGEPGIFEPTPEWDGERSGDRLWS